MAAIQQVNLGLGGPTVAPSFRSISAEVHTVATTLTPAMPSGWQPNDILLIFAKSHSANGVGIPAFTAPTGYTEAFTNTRTNTARVILWYRRAQSGDTARQFSCTEPGGAATNRMSAWQAAYSGCVFSGSPFDEASSSSVGVSTTAPSRTTTGPARLVLNGSTAFVESSAATKSAIVQGSGWAERMDDTSALFATTWKVGNYLQDIAQALAGTVTGQAMDHAWSTNPLFKETAWSAALIGR